MVEDSCKTLDVADGGARLSENARYQLCKTTLDFVLALFMISLASPLICLIAIVVKLTSRGPIIYSQTRLGRDGRPYLIYKIRTMAHDCERQTGPRWATPGDPRVTPVGRLLRRTHLDELPQLWNVLRGEMSLVGPRPERPEFVSQLERAIPRYRERLSVRPGITGLAQVQLPADTDLEGVRRKLACDLYYMHRAGLTLDLRILLNTASNLVGIPAAVSRVLLRMPSVEVAEGTYQGMTDQGPIDAGAIPQVQIA